MTYFILIVIFIITIVLTIGYYNHRISKLLNAPLECPPLDDALKSAREIGRFLSKRANYNTEILITKVDNKNYRREDVSDIYWGKNYQVATFIRLCHAVGCEVIVRQRGLEDIEHIDGPADGNEEIVG